MQAQFTVNRKLKELLSPLSEKEYKMLEESIIKEGCRDKLIVWSDLYNPVLVDGHNRHEICTKHNIPYEIEKMDFDSFQDIEQWIMRNQLSRRNLTDKQRTELIGLLYKEEKKLVPNQQGNNQHSNEDSGHNDHQPKTSEKIAAEFGVTEKTVRRAETFSNAMEELRQNIEPEKVTKILNDEIQISKKDIVELSKEEPEIQNKVINLVETKQAKNLEEARQQLDPIDIEYDRRAKEIDAKDKRIKKVQDLLNYTKYLGITDQHIMEYFEMFPQRYGFVDDLNRLKSIIDEVLEIQANLSKIRRVK